MNPAFIVWFVGKDVTKILGYTNPSKALLDHVDDEDKLNNESLSSLGQRGSWLINESGLYSLILSSKLPTAKKFKRWVTSEVLPSIRNHKLEEKMAEMKKQHEKEIKQLTGDHETYVKKSTINLVAGIQSFLSTYGGDIWLTDKTVVDEMKEKERKLLISAANALIGFAYQMKENLEGNKSD